MAEPETRAPVRHARGERSREAILDAAARLATVEGIDGLSIGRLAQAVGMSKSGLFGHFGSKEDLQLATVAAATGLFEQHVLAPAEAATDGLGRLRLLTDGYLRYVEDDVFPGGCFFASVLSEMDTRPGPVRDRLVGFLTDWLGRLEAAIRQAQDEGSLEATEDPADLAFELESALLFANAQYVASGTTEPIGRARRIIERRLAAATSERAEHQQS
jgi:AcrR family transcriptional regulator